MVESFGMSDLGPWALQDPNAGGGDMVMRMMAKNSMSEDLAKGIDLEVKKIADECYEIALGQMRDNREAIDATVDEALRRAGVSAAERILPQIHARRRNRPTPEWAERESASTAAASIAPAGCCWMAT